MDAQCSFLGSQILSKGKLREWETVRREKCYRSPGRQHLLTRKVPHRVQLRAVHTGSQRTVYVLFLHVFLKDLRIS